MVNYVVLCVLLFLQGYGEGSHYSEHEGLSSPFISSGIAGILLFIYFLLCHSFLNFKINIFI